MGKTIEPCIHEVSATKRYPAGFRVRKQVRDQWGEPRYISEIIRPVDESKQALAEALQEARNFRDQIEREKKTGSIYRRFDDPLVKTIPFHGYSINWEEFPSETHKQIEQEFAEVAEEQEEVARQELTLKDYVEMGLNDDLKIDPDADDVIIGYLRKARGKSNGQWYKSSGAWKAACEWGRIDSLNIDEITGDHVDAWLRWAEGQRKDDGTHKWSASTITGYRMELRRMIKGFARHLREPNPLDLVPTEVDPATIDAPEPTRKTPKKEEAAAVEKTLIKRVSEQPKDSKRRLALMLWRFMSQTGLRPGEALALTVDQINFEKGVITVDRALDREGRVGPTKTGKRYPKLNARPVVISDHTGELLRSWLVEREAHGFPPASASKLVFPEAGGSHWTDGNLQTEIHEARGQVKDLGDDLQLVPYSARHFRVAELRRAGIPEAIASRQLGHKEDTHLRYGLPDVNEMRDCMRKGLG